MGTGAYLLFTLDKLLASAAKQLALMATDPAAARLRGLWEYAQARVALARKTAASPAEAEVAVAAAMAAYRGSIPGALIGTARSGAGGTPVLDEAYAVQYALLPPSVHVSREHPTDIYSHVSADGSAALTLRFLGRPVVDGATVRGGALRGFSYATALPSYLSRLVGTGRLLRGDESADVVDEEALAAEIAA